MNEPVCPAERLSWCKSACDVNNCEHLNCWVRATLENDVEWFRWRLDKEINSSEKAIKYYDKSHCRNTVDQENHRFYIQKLEHLKRELEEKK